MRSFIQCAFFLILLSSSCKNKKNESNAGRIVKIYFAERDMTIIVAINCEDFESFPEDVISTRTITNQDSVNNIYLSLKDAQPVDSTCPLDVRAKIYFYSEKNKISDSVCLDGTNYILINGKCIENHAEVYEKIKKYIW